MELNFAKVGDVVVVKNIKSEIAQIIYQEFYDNEGYGIEFVDTNGSFKYWKQWIDGGYLITKKSKNC